MDEERRRSEDQVFEMMRDDLREIKSDMKDVKTLVMKHEVDIASAKMLGKVAHAIGWPSLAAAVHHAWETMK